MKKRTVFLLCLLLAVAALAVSCGGDGDGGKGSGTSGESGMAAPSVSADPFEIEGCVVTRGKGSSAQMLSASREISTTVASHCGKTMMIREDGTAVSGFEILVGETDRAETAQARAELAGRSLSFIVKRYGNKLVLLGTNEAATAVAVRYFLDTLLPTVAGDAVLTIATDYAHTEELEAVTLLSGKSFRYSIVTAPALQNGTTMKCVQSIQNAVKAITGKSPVYAPDGKAADAVRDERSLEILVGATYYPETAAFTGKLNYNQYGFSMEGNKIVIYGFSDAAMEKATAMFVSLLNGASGKGELSVPATLTLKETDSSVKLTLPAYPSISQKLVSLGTDSTMIYVTDATEAAFRDYATALERAGLKKHDENRLGASLFYTYAGTKRTVTAGYDPTTSTIRIILDNTAARPASASENEGYEKRCEPTLTQLRPELLGNQTGMSYIIRLEDGRFVVIDGGVNDQGDVDRLYDTLCEQNVRGSTPVIAAWLLTHAHGDHYDTFLKFAEKYKGRIVLETAVWNMPPAELCAVDEWSRNHIVSSISTMAGTKVIWARTGQKLRFGSVSIDVWHTPDDLYPAYVKSQNDASVIFRLEIGGQSVMFLADAEAQIANRMVARYGSAMKSDFMQIAHHGYTYSTAMPPLYRAIDPSVVLWPASDEWFHEFQHNRGYNSDVIEGGGNVVEVIAATHGTRVLSFPYTPKPTVLPTYRDGDLIYKADFGGAKYVADLGWELVDDLNGRHTVAGMVLEKRATGKGVYLTGNKYSPVHIVCPDKLVNAPVWTLTMRVDVETLGDGFGIWYNDDQPMEASSPRCVYDVTRTGSFTLTLVNDRQNGTTQVYIDGVLVSTTTNASNDNGRIMLLLQSAKVFVSSLEVRAGKTM